MDKQYTTEWSWYKVEYFIPGDTKAKFLHTTARFHSEALANAKSFFAQHLQNARVIKAYKVNYEPNENIVKGE